MRWRGRRRRATTRPSNPTPTHRLLRQSPPRTGRRQPHRSRGRRSPRIRPWGAVVIEGDGGDTTANAVVHLEDANGDPHVATEQITVAWTTVDSPNPGLARAGSDYIAASGILTFEPGDSQATVPITVKGDTIAERPLLYGEWLPIAFGNPSPNAVIDPVFFGLGIVIILDEPTDRDSAGCAAPSVAATADITMTTSDGPRDYRQHVPSSYSLNPTHPTPLVLAIHGWSDHMARWLEMTEIETFSENEGFVAVMPVGLEDAQGEVTWNAAGTPTATDDLGFIAELLDQLEADICVDLDQVFVLGQSRGAMMASLVACTMPDRVAAVAANGSFLVAPQLCAESRPPAAQIHGDDDQVVDFLVTSLRVQTWALDAGCSTTPDVSTFIAAGEGQLGVDLRTFPGCPTGSALEQYVILGGGHRWPGTPLPEDLEQYAELLGETTGPEFHGTAVAWTFFQNHPMA